MTTVPTHPPKVGYLVVGLVFLGISLTWALGAAGLVGADDLGWLVPLVLVGAGSAGLAALTVRGRSLTRSAGGPGEQPDVAVTDQLLYGPVPDLDEGEQR